MPGLSEKTWRIVQKMFPVAQQEEVGQFLVVECGNNLPCFGELDAIGLERVRFAVLKLSDGNLDVLLGAIESAQLDWRDTFMEADFGYDIMAHNRWADAYLA